MSSYDQLPEDLPVPVDDGAAAHLLGSRVPTTELRCTGSSATLRLNVLTGRTVVFGYPMTGTPGQPLPTGWDAIPGARGCTPQAAGIRDSYAEFAVLGARVVGLSTQTPAAQLEVSQRLQLPYPLLSDSELALSRAWKLPTFIVDGLTLIRRITIFLDGDVVDGLIYPVFPPDRSAEAALAWLREHSGPAEGRPERGRRRGMTHPIPPPLVR